MSAPNWAVGMQRIGPGIYLDRGTKSLHFSDVEICEHFRVPQTPESLAIARKAATDAVQEAIPGVRVMEVEDK